MTYQDAPLRKTQTSLVFLSPFTIFVATDLNRLMATREEYIRLLRSFVSEHGAEYGISRIGIFGSVARGQQTEDSDVDVLIEAPVLDLLSLIGIKHRLEEILGSPVDVVRKTEYMPLQFRSQIEKEVIYV
ncbi:nucleotidyltransferase family protein [Proteiniphilum sp. UBA5384]|uniref:nucleotidyltransferase family protein n=1 Tax=Proteiniphilum sp. UBA5384 TaxID=1947279 RepID=UPI0032E39619